MGPNKEIKMLLFVVVLLRLVSVSFTVAILSSRWDRWCGLTKRGRPKLKYYFSLEVVVVDFKPCHHGLGGYLLRIIAVSFMPSKRRNTVTVLTTAVQYSTGS